MGHIKFVLFFNENRAGFEISECLRGNEVLFHDSLDSVYVYFWVLCICSCVQVHDVKIILYFGLR